MEDALDPFNAFVTRLKAGELSPGPLSDLRLAVKDNIAVKGKPFTAGLPLFADRIADTDASCVARLKAAGAGLVGMTRTDSAGFGVVTPEVRNPIWPSRIVGGSSGGSAAAVAAGLADIGLGTDTGGSTRIPAACCGIFGYKPTHGRIALDGVWPLAQSFDAVGWMTRDLATLERVAGVLLGDPPAQDIKATDLRLGIDPLRIARCSQAVRSAIDAAQTQLAERGLRFHAVALPAPEVLSHAHGVTVLTQARSNYPDWQNHADLLTPTARRSLHVAQAIGGRDVAIARDEITAIGEAYDALLSGVDAIVTPTLPVEPPPVGLNRIELNGNSEPIVSVLVSETCLANLTGAPALSLPIANRSVSLQLLGPRHDDAKLFAIARVLQAAIGSATQGGSA